MWLPRPDQTSAFISGAVILNLFAARKSIEATSGISAQLAVVDLPDPNAFATAGGGSPIIAFSLPWLEALGTDADAIGTTLSHEYAHLKLAHDAQQRHEQDAAAASRVDAATLPSFARFSDHPASRAMTGLTHGYTSDEERAADELGMTWAVDAGYSPCGRIRAMQVYPRTASDDADFSFLSTHPGADERIDYARKIAQQRGLSCGATGKS